MNIFKRIKKWFDEYEIRQHSKDSFHVRLWRRELEKGKLEIGKEIVIIFGGAFNPVSFHYFVYLGEYKGKKVFKEIEKS